MKKINLSVGFIFLILAVLFTIDMVWHHMQGDSVKVSSIIPTIAIFVLAFIYLDLGFTADRRMNNRYNECTACYKKLLTFFERLTDSQNPHEVSARMLFQMQAHDFCDKCFNILTGPYSEEQKNEVQDMVDDILLKVAEVAKFDSNLSSIHQEE